MMLLLVEEYFHTSFRPELYVKNLAMQIAVPFHDQDHTTYDPKFLYIIPPLIQENWFKKFGGPFSRLVNLNRTEPTDITHITDWKNSINEKPAT